MTAITLNPVRFLTADDVYYFSVENRPMQDLSSNDVILQNAIETLATQVSNSAAPSFNVAVPTTGQTVVVAPTTKTQIISPAGALAALTVQFPTAASDGVAFELSISQSITVLTMTPALGETILGAITAVTNYSATKFRFSAATNVWYRVS